MPAVLGTASDDDMVTDIQVRGAGTLKIPVALTVNGGAKCGLHKS